MSDANFAAYEAQNGQFIFMVPIIQNFINADQNQYKGFYVDDTNFFGFRSSLGALINAFVNEDTI